MPEFAFASQSGVLVHVSAADLATALAVLGNARNLHERLHVPYAGELPGRVQVTVPAALVGPLTVDNLLWVVDAQSGQAYAYGASTDAPVSQCARAVPPSVRPSLKPWQRAPRHLKRLV